MDILQTKRFISKGLEWGTTLGEMNPSIGINLTKKQKKFFDCIWGYGGHVSGKNNGEKVFTVLTQNLSYVLYCFGTNMAVLLRKCNQRIEERRKKSQKRPFRFAHVKGDTSVALNFLHRLQFGASCMRGRHTDLCFEFQRNKTDRPQFFSGNKCRHS